MDIKIRKSKVWRGNYFANAVKVYLFRIDTKYNIPVQLITATGNPHKMEQRAVQVQKNVGLTKNYAWDSLEIDWSNVNVKCDSRELQLPSLVTIPLMYKFKV